MAEQHSEDKPVIDPETGATNKGASGSSATGTGAKSDKGSMEQRDQKADTDVVNTGDRHAQANLGGRNPGESRAAMGDQDSTQNRNDMTLVDPLTSRAPDKLDELKEKRDGKGEFAQRDP